MDISTFIAPPISSTNLENPSKHVILDFSTEGLVRFKIFPLNHAKLYGFNDINLPWNHNISVDVQLIDDPD